MDLLAAAGGTYASVIVGRSLSHATARCSAVAAALCVCVLLSVLAPVARANALTQQGPKITPSDEFGGGSAFGDSVALSADGNTAVIGGPDDGGSGTSYSNTGAVWIYTRTGSTWTEQAKLTAPYKPGGAFGASVALSADGNTALIGSGSPGDGFPGAAWVFTRSGTTWTEQAKLAAPSDEIGNSDFGSSVSLSGDGNTALIGGPSDNAYTGAAWVFTRSAGAWSEKEKLLATEEPEQAEFGTSVALSGDAGTALIGDGDVTNFNGIKGNAWVFTQSAGSWKQQGPELSGGEEVGNGDFGGSVALSETGNTALIGGRADDSGSGAAWIFTRTGSEWKQQGSKLTGAHAIETPVFGYSVALAADGTTALIGGVDDDEIKGAAWVFSDDAGTWTEREKLIGGEESEGEVTFGLAVALSAESTTALIGGPADHNNIGAAWAFSAGPETPTGGGGPQGTEKTQGQRTPTDEKTQGQRTPNSSSAFAAGASASTIALACTTRELTLIDVYQSGKRVLLSGAAAPSLHGQRVTILFDDRERAATAIVQQDGLFSASAPLPPPRLRASNRTRYVAVLGDQRSLELKLTRRLILEQPASAHGKVTLTGQVLPPLTSPRANISITELTSCHGQRVVTDFRPDGNGRFSITFAAPTGRVAAAFRLTTLVRATPASGARFTTYSLPLVVTIG
jgi:hypothetical protein